MDKMMGLGMSDEQREQAGKDELSSTTGLANFDVLALGTRFKYRAGGKVWVKISHDNVAEWREEETATNWIGQPICSAKEENETLLVRIIGN